MNVKARSSVQNLQIGPTFNGGGLKVRRTTLYFSCPPQNASIGLAGEPKIRRATLNPEPNHKLRCRREGSDLRNRSVVVVRVRPSVRSAAPFHVTRDVRAAVPRRRFSLWEREICALYRHEPKNFSAAAPADADVIVTGIARGGQAFPQINRRREDANAFCQNSAL